ncbi:gag/pol protein [Cucumis melo var. makuwa]|uniref:Gag/pol protein n=1 Tax=Cucumis melo var. makuwa TaxID=1194695 RepID=A0A5A7V9T3_CUCMM|nr:gag/pol protein [Cucumis melo var. makuwa]TYK05152.1 gag/pol protein [Cucumis melo var. makuwa]
MGGPSSKTKVGPSQMNKKGKGKISKNSKGKKVSKGKYYHCNQNGHWLRNCPKYLAEKKADKEAQVLEKLLEAGSSSKFETLEVVSIEAAGHLKLF